MTFGHELSGNLDCMLEMNSEYRITHAWPYLVHKKLNFEECINYGWPGASTDRIVRTTYQYIHNYLSGNRNINDLFVIICWTNENRHETYIENRWVDILPGTITMSAACNKMINLSRLFTETIWGTNANRINVFNKILSCQYMLEFYKIKYMFCYAFPIDFKKVNDLQNHIPFLQANKNMGFSDKDLSFMAYTKGLPVGKLNHPLEEGHEKWSNRIVDFIIERDLLK